MNSNDLPSEIDRKHAQRAEARNRAATYTHRNRATILPNSTGMSVQCPRCAAQVLYAFNDQEINCENCGEFIQL